MEKTKAKAKAEINRFAQFHSAELESKYFESRVSHTMPHRRFVFLVWGIAYLLIGVWGLLPFTESGGNWASFALRCIVPVVSVALYSIMKRPHTRRTLELLSIGYAALVYAVFLLVQLVQASTNVAQQCMGLMVLVLVSTLLPAGWLYIMAVDAAAVLAFLLFYIIMPVPVPWQTIFQDGFYLVLSLAFAGYSQHRLNYHQRVHFYEEQHMERLMRTDSLTQIYNRLSFDQTLENWCGNQREGDHAFSLVLFDIDKFKHVNDTYGHLVGDSVLVEAAELVRRQIRAGDVFARWGGEEFMILLPGANLQQAADFAERLRRLLASHRFKTVSRVTCSFGVVTYRQGETSTALIRRVDNLLYEAKNNGRNRVEVAREPKASPA